MDNGIIAYGQSSIDPKNINRSDYLNTLAVEALRVGLLTDADITRLQNGLMQTLSEVIGYSSENHSTSVMADTAREFSKSILYNVDTYLLTLPDYASAIEEMKTHGMSDMYGRGYLINKKRFENAKVLYARVRYTRLHGGSKDYNKLIDVNMKKYLEMYDPRFNAHSRLYVMLSEYGIRGKYSMDQLPALMKQLIDINSGHAADVTIEADGAGE